VATRNSAKNTSLIELSAQRSTRVGDSDKRMGHSLDGSKVMVQQRLHHDWSENVGRPMGTESILTVFHVLVPFRARVPRCACQG
jgi:hypothetical protein